MREDIRQPLAFGKCGQRVSYAGPDRHADLLHSPRSKNEQKAHHQTDVSYRKSIGLQGISDIGDINWLAAARPETDVDQA